MRLSLGDIAWNRNGRAADLVGKTVDLVLGKTVGQFVDLRNHVHGLLPNHEIFEMLSHIVRPRVPVLWVPGTEYWVLLTTMPDMHYVSILHNVVFAFQPQRAFGSGIRFG